MEKLLWLWITIGSLIFIGLIIVFWYLIITKQYKKIRHQINISMLEINELILSKRDLLEQINQQTNKLLKSNKKDIENMLKISKIEATDTVKTKQDISFEISQAMQDMYQNLDLHEILKNDNDIKNILDAWTITEQSLQVTRRLYNKNVSSFNHKLSVFPSEIVGRFNRYKRIDFFEEDIILAKR